MSETTAGRKRRKRDIRKLAGVKRRITKLCNELLSLQRIQEGLEYDIDIVDREIAGKEAAEGGRTKRKRRKSKNNNRRQLR